MSDITQLRADFTAAYARWRDTGEHDEDWMRGAAAHFRQLCIDTETDAERSKRIKAEVQAAKQTAAIEDMKKRYGGRVPV